jgi:hypothetical protein
MNNWPDRARLDAQQERLDREAEYLCSRDDRALRLTLAACTRLRAADIATGSIHGSATNLLLSYAAGATAVDPVAYDLPLERITGGSLPSLTLVRVSPRSMAQAEAALCALPSAFVVADGGAGCIRICDAASTVGPMTWVIPDWRVEIASAALRPDLAGECSIFRALRYENPALVSVVATIRPSTFEEVLASLALARPGPLASGLVDAYRLADSGSTPAACRALLARTRGVLLYHEQVVRIGMQYAGLHVEDAGQMQRDLLFRREDLFPQWRGQFVAQAVARGALAECALEVFSFLMKWTPYTAHRGHFASCAADLLWLDAGLAALGRLAANAILNAQAEMAMRTGCREFEPIQENARLVCGHCKEA